MTTKINAEKLIAILKKNREKHHEFFVAALEGYKATLNKEFERRIEALRAGNWQIQTYIQLDTPIDQTFDYDRVIKMLEMHDDAKDTLIELNEIDFACYVMDQWSWKQNVLLTNSRYTGGATPYH